MIKEPTVFILGAGASKPFKFPTGIELVNAIRQNVTSQNDDTLRLYTANSIKPSELKKFAHALLYSGKDSIDQFLEHRTEFIEIGKLAIAQELIKYEDESILFRTGDWYRYIFGKLNASFETFDENKISVVTFNYDRSFEQYLFTALKNSYGKNDDECAEKIKNIPIIHVHGQLGKLPWQDKHGRVYKDQHLDLDACSAAAAGIKIIHEDEDYDAFRQAQVLLRRAKNIYFLGFGYNKTNVKRLSLPRDSSSKGTAFGLEDAEKASIQALLLNHYNHTIYLDPSPVLHFLRSKVSFVL